MRSLLRLLLVGAVLVLALAVSAACGSQPAAAPTQAPVSTQATAAQATQPAANPTTASAASAQQDSQDAGPSLSKSPAAANTRHYQGDPNAPVVMIEVSDFQ